MIKPLVSSKKETGCVYLQCECGNELLKIYHYPVTNTCDEILLLDYIGGIPDIELIKYKHVNLSSSQLDELIENLVICCKEEYFVTEMLDVERVLRLVKEKSGEIKIELYHLFEDKKKNKQKELVWDIHVKVPELEEFIQLIKELKEKIKEVNSNVTTNNK